MLWVDEGEMRATELATRAQQFGSELAMDLSVPLDMVEGSESHPGVIGEVIGGTRHACPNWLLR